MLKPVGGGGYIRRFSIAGFQLLGDFLVEAFSGWCQIFMETRIGLSLGMLCELRCSSIAESALEFLGSVLFIISGEANSIGG